VFGTTAAQAIEDEVTHYGFKYPLAIQNVA
jgi:hypothetical protein